MLNKLNWDVRKFCSKEESRYSLQAIHVTPDATVATDGHRLAWVSADGFKSEHFPIVSSAAPATDEFKPFLVSADLAAKIEKAIPRDGRSKGRVNIPVCQRAAVGIDGERITIAVTDLESPQVFDATRQPAGQFPSYQAVIPKWEEATSRFCVNAEYLAEIAAFASSMNAKGDVSIVVSLYDSPDNGKAIRFDASHEEQGYTAVLMPMRGHQTVKERAWKEDEEEFRAEWIQPANTYGYVDAVKAKAEAEARFAESWDAAHAEEIERAWDAAHAEAITRNDPFQNTQSFEQVAFTTRLVGDAEPETTLYVNVPVSDTLLDKLTNHVQRDAAHTGNRGIFLPTKNTHLVGEAIHFLSLHGIVVVEVSPEDHAPAGFIRNATPRERVAQRIPISILDMMPEKIDARPITSPNNTANRYMGPVRTAKQPTPANRDVADAANAF